MRLYRGKIPVIAEEIVNELTIKQEGEENPDIETEAPAEVQLDIEAVLKEYLRRERQVLDEAKSRLEGRNLPYSQLGKIKSAVAREQKMPLGEDMLPYLLEQVLTMLFHSGNVEEIFAEDHVLRKKMTKIMRRHMEMEAELDKEVRSKIKNLQEGTASFEIEYARAMDEIKRKKRLT